MLEPLDLNALVLDVLTLYENSPIAIRPNLAIALPQVAGDPSQLRQVIHNILRNAARYARVEVKSTLRAGNAMGFR